MSLLARRTFRIQRMAEPARARTLTHSTGTALAALLLDEAEPADLDCEVRTYTVREPDGLRLRNGDHLTDGTYTGVVHTLTNRRAPLVDATLHGTTEEAP